MLIASSVSVQVIIRVGLLVATNFQVFYGRQGERQCKSV